MAGLLLVVVVDEAGTGVAAAVGRGEGTDALVGFGAKDGAEGGGAAAGVVALSGGGG
jgi:hypothetical protein